MRRRITFKDLPINRAAVVAEKQMDELLQLAITGKIEPLIEVLDFLESSSVFEKMGRETITRRMDVKIPQ